MRHDLFKAVNKLKEKGAYVDFDDETKRYYDRIYRDFRRNGIDLTDEKERDEIKALQKDISEKEKKACENI